jgi:hypothetical protein
LITNWPQEKTTTTFLDSLQTTLHLGGNLNNNNNNNNNSITVNNNLNNGNNNNNNNNLNNNNNNKDKNGNGSTPSKTNKNSVADDFPLVTWETSGEGKKIPIVTFNCLVSMS